MLPARVFDRIERCSPVGRGRPLSAFFSDIVKTCTRIIVYRELQGRPRGGTDDAKQLRWNTGILCFSSFVTAQTVGEPSSQQQPGTSFERLKLQGVLYRSASIVDARQEPSASPVRRIERRRRDSVWNGVLIGAGAGALAGFGLGRSLDSPGCPLAGSECGQGAMVGTVGGAFWGAIGGWITDALIRKKETIYVVQDPK
jgi:hypothetical protein